MDETPDPSDPSGGEEHSKNARPSTKEKHQKGKSRKSADRDGEKADSERPARRKRPKRWLGKWPPARPPKSEVNMEFAFQAQWPAGFDIRPIDSRLVGILIDAGGQIANRRPGHERDEQGRPITVLTLSVDAVDARQFWAKVRESLERKSNRDIRAHLIVVSEGSRGWDNYLLLMHFDKSEILDEF